MRLAAIIALVPLAAYSQTSTAPAPATPPAPPAPAAEPARAAPASAPRWSIGAGVSSSSTTLLGTPLLYVGLGYASPSVPGVTASVERRVSDRTWLVAGLSGAVSRTEQDVPAGDTGTTRSDLTQLAVSGGVRNVITRPGAAIEVSALALLDAGVLDGRVDRFEYAGLSAPVAVSYDETGWLVGASLGVALDRALTDGLSLRLATPLARANYTSTRTRVAGERLDGSDLAVRVELAPRLELRLAF